MERSSKFHERKIELKTKLILMFLGSAFSLAISSPIKLFAIFSLIVLTLIWVEPDALKAFSRFKKLIILFLSLIVLQNLFSPSGKVFLSVGGHTILSEGGISNAINGVLRVVNMFLLGAMIAVEPPERITESLEELGVPHKLALMVSVALLFLSTFRREALDMLTAMKIRGVDIETRPLKEKMSLYFRLSFPLTLSALRKAQTMAAVIEVRGFGSKLRKSKFRPLSNLGIVDIVIIGLFIVSEFMIWRGL